MWFLLLMPFLFSNVNISQSNRCIDEKVVLESKNLNKERKLNLLNEQDTFDVMTYDNLGNKNYYKHDDFSYNQDIELLPHDAIKDNREKPNRTNEQYLDKPYSAVCAIYTTYDTDNNGTGDTTFIGTGALVGPSEVLTAEENTYHSDYGYPTSLFVVPGEHKENGVLIRPFGTHYMTMVARGNYHSTFDGNDNWALIKINSEIGYTTGWFGVSNTGISNSSTIKVLGYNNTTSHQVVAYQGTVSSLGTYKFYHSALPTMMANGAPILDISLNTIYGIQTGDRITTNNTTKSIACKVSVYIKNWIQEDCGALRITIFAQPSGSGSSSGGGYGHAWLSIENNYPSYITVGHKSVSSGSAVSIGTWNIAQHQGIFYNMEYYDTHNNYDLFPERVSYSRNLFQSQWTTINDYIINHDTWEPLYNCAGFAVGVWNTAFSQYQINCGGIFPLPNSLVNKITLFNGYENHAEVKGTNNVYYYNGTTLVQVQPII